MAVCNTYGEEISCAVDYLEEQGKLLKKGDFVVLSMNLCGAISQVHGVPLHKVLDDVAHAKDLREVEDE